MQKIKFIQAYSISSILLFSFLIAGCQPSQKKDGLNLTTIKSTTEYIRYKINNNERVWHINPSLNPDILRTECTKAGSLVSFITDADSVSFKVNVNDTIRFAVILNHDTAYTEIIGVPKNVNFNEAYKKQHSGGVSIDIPEVSELANIIMAISNVGLKDSNMINMQLPYYEKVLKWFLPYKDEPVIKHIDSLQQSHDETYDYSFYYSMKMNACGYYFDLHDNIAPDSTIIKWGFNDIENVFQKNLNLIDGFAKKSNFRQFYLHQKPYYDSLIAEYKERVPVLKMKKWLEEQFPNKIDYYNIIFSPLVYGAHATSSFRDNDFAVAAMFVAPFFHSQKSPASDDIRNARILFTEIDHNYVNPVSYQYIDNINYIFKDHQKWKKQGKLVNFYPDGFNVFNEYMTWAVFVLYCYDNYTEADFKIAKLQVENFMEEKRGFIKFSAFDDELLQLYKHNKNKGKLYGLFPEILQWCYAQ